MTFIIFVITWAVVGGACTDGAIGFFAALFTSNAYRSGRRLKAIEARLKALEAGATTLAPEAAAALRASSVEKPRTTEEPRDEIGEVASTTPDTNEVISEPFVATTVVASQDSPLSAPEAPRITQTKIRPAPLTVEERLRNYVGSTIAGFLCRGNPIARIGVVILFFGVAFALKFATDQGYVPVELRIIGAALGGLLLIALGWKLRHTRRGFAAALMGGGSGVLYITTFISFRVLNFIGQLPAFALLTAITALAASLAVVQNASALALLAMIGGFLVPVLTSNGDGNHVALFSYLAILNLGIFGICWFRSWRALNLTGLFFTALLGFMWGAAKYVPELFSTTEPFLAFFLALYIAITILYSARAERSRADAIDSILVFGVPLLALLFQAPLVHPWKYGLAWSTFGLGALHLALSEFVRRQFSGRLKFLSSSYYVIGLALVSLSVSLAFSGHVTSAVWALEGVALLWSGIEIDHKVQRRGAMILIVLSSLAFLGDLPGAQQRHAFLNSFFEGVAMLAGAGIGASRLLLSSRAEKLPHNERAMAPFFAAIGFAWWFFGSFEEFSRHMPGWFASAYGNRPELAMMWLPYCLGIGSVFVTLSIAAFWAISLRFPIPGSKFLRSTLLPGHGIVLYGLAVNSEGSLHPLMSYGGVAWPLLAVANYVMLWWDEKNGDTSQGMQHLFGLWILSLVPSWEGYRIVRNVVGVAPAWSQAMLTVIPALIAFVIGESTRHGRPWPFRERARLYHLGLQPFIMWLFLFPFILNLSASGNATPLPYLPILNPLDVAQILAIGVALSWWRRSVRIFPPPPATTPNFLAIVGVWSFVWATTGLIRAVHHYAGVPWDFDTLFDSSTVQASLSLFWSVLALILMLVGHRRGWRLMWQEGAALIAIVVVKLFLIELSSQGTLARIAAFLGVGLLMLVIGYMAPIPPEAGKAAGSETSLDPST